MPSLRTLFRAVVMGVVVVVGVKGWHLYGPTNEQVSTAFAQVSQLVKSKIESYQQSSGPSANPADVAESPAAPFAATPPVAAPSLMSPPPAQAEPPKLLPQGAGPTAPLPMPFVAQSMPPVSPVGDRMPQLMARLQQMGAAETALTPWGSDGQMYRFSCKAPLANAPAMTQHFESVAAEPVAAVEQVVAKVEAWRVAQRDGGLRY